MEFYLQSNDSGRVFIDSTVRKDCLVERTLTANSWDAARQKVNDMGFIHKPGYGFFKELS